ncbi:MAG: ABC transporter family substrate-binding protein [Trebonia sp.]|uniref:ABC transporter family substrate-binding protein n=1 Tax=Trebonia sp. TaxID=2767075 RepID=UPI003BAE616A
MKNKRIFGGLALALAGMTALAACSSSGSSSSTPSSSSSAASVKSGGTFTYALDQDMAGFNILNLNDDEFVLQEVLNQVWPQVYITTNTLNEQLDTNYVTSAKVTSSNPQTVVYQINPKATWSDGVPFNAQDVIYNWQAQSGNPKFTDVGGKAFEPATTAGYSLIKSVTSSNGGKTATVVFSSPFGDWKSLFGPMIPAHIAEKVGFNNGFQTFNAAVKVSGGPFEIQSYTQGQDIVEVRNSKWWGTPAPLDKLVFRIFADDNQIPPALQNSEVNGANPAQASLQFKDAIASVPNLTTSIIPGLEFQHMDFNQANPYLAKLDVRQAIAYGTNRADMVNRIVGPITASVKPLNNRIFMPNQPQYTDTSGGLGDFDPAKAKQLLQASGMTMGSDGYFHPSSGPEAGKDLTFSISTTSGEPVRSEIEQLFQSYMKNVGIKINIQNYSPNTLFGTVGPKSEFDIIEFAWVSTPFPSGNISIYCSYTNSNLCGQNWDHYANPQLDKLLNQAAGTLDTTAAATLYNQADALLWKDMVTLPLFQQPQLYTWNNTYGNVLPNPSNNGLTWNAQTWGLKAT